MKPEMQDSRVWRQDMFETTNGGVMVARGRGGQVRGLNHNGVRPDHIIFDDLEDKEAVKTEEQRDKTLDWFYGDLMPALPEMDPNATITGMGTILHGDSLLMRLMKDPQWTVVKFGVRDRKGKWVWPQNIDERKYLTKKNSAAITGTLSAFHLEYDSEVIDDETRIFPETFYRCQGAERNGTVVKVDLSGPGNLREAPRRRVSRASRRHGTRWTNYRAGRLEQAHGRCWRDRR
ncbi:MAG: hypothetical protein HC883_00590 [Bdellovibrionaceae bacterium]|nr:hypothetical protein [Pseudobdellovibrionaceae bacterium]